MNKQRNREFRTRHIHTCIKSMRMFVLCYVPFHIQRQSENFHEWTKNENIILWNRDAYIVHLNMGNIYFDFSFVRCVTLPYKKRTHHTRTHTHKFTTHNPCYVQYFQCSIRYIWLCCTRSLVLKDDSAYPITMENGDTELRIENLRTQKQQQQHQQ